MLHAVAVDNAYANLTLPRLIAEAGLTSCDAVRSTELAYGTLRACGTLDEIIGACAGHDPSSLEPDVLNLLRLGSYQLLRTPVPPHAAVSTVADLTRRVTNDGSAINYVNAVLRAVSDADWDTWVKRLSEGESTLQTLAMRTAHPEWIVRAFSDALGGDEAELAKALRADDRRPKTHLVALPGCIERAELACGADADPGPYSPYAVRLTGGDPFKLGPVREHRAAIQDEGSQLCAIALTQARLEGRDERWLDLCAGPGEKTELLAALAALRGARVTANELDPHRAALVRARTAKWEVKVQVGDGRLVPAIAGGYDRVLLDAPCSGLGSLRHRPEARWHLRPSDLPELAVLQAELLAAALRLVRPGGIVAYVVGSPHPAETTKIVAGALSDAQMLDARHVFPGVDRLGRGPTVQLWPHRQDTDAVFCALMRRSGSRADGLSGSSA